MHIFIIMDNFDLKKFLVENKLTEISRLDEVKIIPSKTGFKPYYAVVNIHGDYYDKVAKYIVTNSKKEMINKLNDSLKDVEDRPMYELSDLDDYKKENEDSLRGQHYIFDDWAWVTDKEKVFQEDIKAIEEYLEKKVVKF